MNIHRDLIDRYQAGPAQLRRIVAGMSPSQLDAAPITGQWSTRQVVCHIADFDLVYADRMKRVIAEREPSFFGGDPDTFAAGLAYDRRDVEEELQVIEAVRRQVSRILWAVDEHALERIGHHSEAGPLSLATLLRSAAEHLPHHAAFIERKRAAIGA